MSPAGKPSVTLNGTTYRWPRRPVVVVCVDGGDPAYFDAALAAAVVPNIARFMKAGYSGIAECVIPSFTCPNNVSIVTGSPASGTGSVRTPSACTSARLRVSLEVRGGPASTRCVVSQWFPSFCWCPA